MRKGKIQYFTVEDSLTLLRDSVPRVYGKSTQRVYKKPFYHRNGKMLVRWLVDLHRIFDNYRGYFNYLNYQSSGRIEDKAGDRDWMGKIRYYIWRNFDFKAGNWINCWRVGLSSRTRRRGCLQSSTDWDGSISVSRSVYRHVHDHVQLIFEYSDVLFVR